MAKSSTPPPDTGKSKPETPTTSKSTPTRVISSRVFNDFAAI